MNTDDNTDLKSSVTMLQTLLEVLHTVLKYVSDVVKKALQVRGNQCEQIPILLCFSPGDEDWN